MTETRVSPSSVAYFACRECTEVFSSDVNLKVHLLSHAGLDHPASIGCSKCDSLIVFDIKQLRQHVSTCHSSKPRCASEDKGSVDIDVSNPKPLTKSIEIGDYRKNVHRSYQLQCLICSKTIFCDSAKQFGKHLETHSLNAKHFYCLWPLCDAEKDMDTELNPKSAVQGRLSEYLLHVANHCVNGEADKEKIQLMQSVLMQLMSSLSQLKSQLLSSVQDTLLGEDDEQSKAAIFIHELLNNLKPRNKVRKLMRQNSLTNDRSPTSAQPLRAKLERDDSVFNEFGGLCVAKCSLCDIRFQSTVEAQVHVLAHREVTEPYLACALCNQLKKYSKVDSLRQHLKCHAKENSEYNISSLPSQGSYTTPVTSTDISGGVKNPANIIRYLNQQTQQLQKTMSEDSYPSKANASLLQGKGKCVRFKRELSCPETRVENGKDSNDEKEICVEDIDEFGASSDRKRMKVTDNESQVFHCHECNVSFQLEDFQDFCDHLHQHIDDSKLFRCYVCKQRFEGIEMMSFVKHLCVHMVGDMKEISCSRCGITFQSNNIDQFCAHVSQHRQLDVFQCDECHNKFSLSKDIIHHLHYSECSNTASVSCRLCQWKSFSNLALLISHLNNEHKIVSERCITEVYCCHLCQYSERCILSYQAHYLHEHNSYIHICMLCMQVFHDQIHLVEHLHNFHAQSYGALKQAATSASGNNTLSQQVSDACLVSVSSVICAVYQSLTSHTLLHCDICHIYFENEQTHAAHMNRHSKVSGDECDACHAHFPSHEQLALHLMSGCKTDRLVLTSRKGGHSIG